MFASPLPAAVDTRLAQADASAALCYSGSILSGTTVAPVYCGFPGDGAAGVHGETIIDPTTGVSLVLVDPAIGDVGEGSSGSDAAMYADSTLRKRRAKMNKHKRRKWRRKMRNLGGQNLKKK